MRTYLLLAAAEFRRYSTYRLAILAGVTTQSVFGFIRISVLSAAISSAGGTLAGYNQQLAATYVWLGQALFAAVALFLWVDIAERVSSGDIAVDFSRPSICSSPGGHVIWPAPLSICCRAVCRL